MTVQSDVPCPKCKKHDYWRMGIYLNKSGKTVTVINHCDHCHRWFRIIHYTVKLDKKGNVKE